MIISVKSPLPAVYAAPCNLPESKELTKYSQPLDNLSVISFATSILFDSASINALDSAELYLTPKAIDSFLILIYLFVHPYFDEMIDSIFLYHQNEFEHIRTFDDAVLDYFLTPEF